jgi:hypothetical protein
MSKNIIKSPIVYSIYGINNCHNFLLYNSTYLLIKIVRFLKTLTLKV